MIRGVISGISAMRAQVRNQEVIANNLANADTAAYNKDKVVFSTFNDVLMYALRPSAFPVALGGVSSGALVQDIETIRSVGPIENTGNPLDIALPGGQYLAVETAGGVRYTRRGDLRVSADGYLNVGGYRVLGRNGPIKIEGSGPKSVLEDGSVVVGGQTVGALTVLKFQDESALIKEGNCLFKLTSGQPVEVESPGLVAGALEKSSVDPVTEMVSLIYAMRTYEAAQRAVQSHDETLQQAVSRVGSVAS